MCHGTAVTTLRSHNPTITARPSDPLPLRSWLFIPKRRSASNAVSSTTSLPAGFYLPETLATYLGVSTSTIYSWNSSGYGPPFVKLGNLVRYTYEDVKLWLAKQLELGGEDRQALPPGSGLSGMTMGQLSADAHFIVMLISHHEGAIAMAELALQRSKRPEIRALAERIRTSQSQENAQMRRWYRLWYASDVPTWPGLGMCMRGGMGHRPSRAAETGGGDGAGAERGDRADGPLVPAVVRHSEPLKPPRVSPDRPSQVANAQLSRWRRPARQWQQPAYGPHRLPSC